MNTPQLPDWEQEFDKEFPEHDKSHCTGHTYPEFEGRPNRDWVKGFIRDTLSAQQSTLTKQVEEAVRAVRARIRKEINEYFDGGSDEFYSQRTKEFCLLVKRHINETIASLTTPTEGK